MLCLQDTLNLEDMRHVVCTSLSPNLELSVSLMYYVSTHKDIYIYIYICMYVKIIIFV